MHAKSPEPPKETSMYVSCVRFPLPYPGRSPFRPRCLQSSIGNSGDCLAMVTTQEACNADMILLHFHRRGWHPESPQPLHHLSSRRRGRDAAAAAAMQPGAHFGALVALSFRGFVLPCDSSGRFQTPSPADLRR